MRICIAGGTGLIGSTVKSVAEAAGHQVTVVRVPRPPKRNAHNPESWADALEAWEPATFSGFDALMFFGGESISSRWTSRKRQRIELSRQMPCRRMACCAAAATEPPHVILSASAVGYYGDQGEDSVSEKSNMGKGFLAPTTATWEATWELAQTAGIRLILLRLGVVLSPQGGALKVMLPAFKAGVGGPMGGGKQWMPWITLEDAAQLAVWAVGHDSISGPVNAVAPEPVRQADFAKALGRALHRPAVAPAPSFVLRAMFGQMAKETILSSCRAIPQKATAAGFQFRDPEIGQALAQLLDHHENRGNQDRYPAG